MRTGKYIMDKQRISLVFFITFFLSLATIGNAQNGKEISLSVYPGFTLVNFEKALDYSDDYLEDWSELHVSAALRGFLLSEKPVQFGLEVAWQKLYYAYYRVPYVPSPLHYEFDVSTLSLLALGRYSINSFFTVGGAGVHIFDDGIAPAICLEAGYKVNTGTNMKIPLSVRISPVFGDGTPILFSIGAGISYTIK